MADGNCWLIAEQHCGRLPARRGLRRMLEGDDRRVVIVALATRLAQVAPTLLDNVKLFGAERQAVQPA